MPLALSHCFARSFVHSLIHWDCMCINICVCAHYVEFTFAHPHTTNFPTIFYSTHCCSKTCTEVHTDTDTVTRMHTKIGLLLPPWVSLHSLRAHVCLCVGVGVRLTHSPIHRASEWAYECECVCVWKEEIFFRMGNFVGGTIMNETTF